MALDALEKERDGSREIMELPVASVYFFVMRVENKELKQMEGGSGSDGDRRRDSVKYLCLVRLDRLEIICCYNRLPAGKKVKYDDDDNDDREDEVDEEEKAEKDYDD